MVFPVGVTKTGDLEKANDNNSHYIFTKDDTFVLLPAAAYKVPGYINSGLCHDRSRHLQTPGAVIRAGRRLPLASLAEETVIVTAQPVDSAVSPTQGYSARTSTGATKPIGR
jgi:hypothetical protein